MIARHCGDDEFVSPPIRLTSAAYANVLETGIDPEVDRIRIRDGKYTVAELLDACLDGADEDRVQGWREYVATIEYAANVRNQQIDMTAVQS